MTALGPLAVRHSGACDTRPEPLRATFLTPTPSPYMRDLFAAMTRDGRIAPRVLYLEKGTPTHGWDEERLPGYAEVLPGGWVRFLGARVHANPGAVAHIRRTRPDVAVVAGYSGLTNQAVMCWLKATRTPWVFYGEIPGFQNRGRVGRALRALARWPAVRWSHGIAAVGTRAAAAYRALAPRRLPVANIPYFCDMSAFASARTTAPTGPDRPLRFLYCGQLVHRKGVDLLVRAFARLAQRHEHVRLRLVGDGELLPDLRTRVPESVRGRIEFTGFLQVNQLPAQFADADVFLLPSRHDGWGVVVNQALAAGLAVVCSDAVGATDLVAPGENGLIVPAGDEDALYRAMDELAADPEKTRRFAERSRTAATDWAPECGVDRWYDLLQTVLRNRSRART
jgi:glycosyltransferase involved in cell wall biosynthesis